MAATPVDGARRATLTPLRVNPQVKRDSGSWTGQLHSKLDNEICYAKGSTWDFGWTEHSEDGLNEAPEERDLPSNPPPSPMHGCFPSLHESPVSCHMKICSTSTDASSHASDAASKHGTHAHEPSHGSIITASIGDETDGTDCTYSSSRSNETEETDPVASPERYLSIHSKIEEVFSPARDTSASFENPFHCIEYSTTLPQKRANTLESRTYVLPRAPTARSPSAKPERSQTSTSSTDLLVDDEATESRSASPSRKYDILSQGSYLETPTPPDDSKYMRSRYARVTEKKTDYGRGGYARVMPGKILNRELELIVKIGVGQFSTVWLAYSHDNKDYVAVKICRSDPKYYHNSKIELNNTYSVQLAAEKAMEQNQDETSMFRHTKVLDEFDFIGGCNKLKHHAIVLELQGMSMMELLRRNSMRGLPVKHVKRIARQLLESLAYLHSQGIIHTDVKPDNILLDLPQDNLQAEITAFRDDVVTHHRMVLQRQHDANVRNGKAPASYNGFTGIERTFYATPVYPVVTNTAWAGQAKVDLNRQSTIKRSRTSAAHPSSCLQSPFVMSGDDLSIKLADLGNAQNSQTDKTFGQRNHVCTLQYRPPENLLGCRYGSPVDIWAAACTIFELLTGDMLFNPNDDVVKQPSRYNKFQDLLAQHQELMGDIPSAVLATARSDIVAREFNEMQRCRFINLRPCSLHAILTQRYRMPQQLAQSTVNFLEGMLDLNQATLKTAIQMLAHPWLRITDDDDVILFRPPSIAGTPQMHAREEYYDRYRPHVIARAVLGDDYDEEKGGFPSNPPPFRDFAPYGGSQCQLATSNDSEDSGSPSALYMRRPGLARRCTAPAIAQTLHRRSCSIA